MNSVDDLIEKYPKIFDKDTFWGFECDDGWYDILDKLCGDIQFYCDNNDIPQVSAIQVKEKFAGLRFYTTPAPDQIYDMINQAEKKSLETCEKCGKPGKRRGSVRSWLYTACDQHTNEEDLDNEQRGSV